MAALADVIVDVAVWSLDRPLTYVIPEDLTEQVRVGSVVRVPLRRRRVRGWVVDRRAGDQAEMEKVAGVSGQAPVFDEALLSMARRLSRTYVHPLSSFLGLFTPPRMGRRAAAVSEAPSTEGSSGSRNLVRLAPGEDAFDRYTEVIHQDRERGLGSILMVPEVREGSRLLDRLEAELGGAAVVHSGRSPAERSQALWGVARGRNTLVLGGRGAVFCPPLRLGTIIVHQEHDRSFKEQRSPYYGAVEAALARADATGCSLLLASGTPSLLTRHRAEAEGWVKVVPSRERERSLWPIVEVLEPGRSAVPRRAAAALIEAHRSGRRSMVLLPRVQSTRAGPGPARVVQLLERMVPDARVTRADRSFLGSEPGKLLDSLSGEVVVATTSALADLPRPELHTAVVLGLDAYLKRPEGRAVEETFESLWSLGSLLARPGRQGRLLLETSLAEHHLVQALTRGDYEFFAERELRAREEGSWPPLRRLARIYLSGDPQETMLDRLRGLRGTKVLGPVTGARGPELLLKVEVWEEVVGELRGIVAEGQPRMLVELDPRDW